MRLSFCSKYNFLNITQTFQARWNQISTDAQYGYPCYADNALVNYLNQPNVREALHIPSFIKSYHTCR